MLILFYIVVIGLWIGGVFWLFNIRGNEIEHRLKTKEHCGECDKDYFVCPICGCQKETQRDVDVCKSWDLILGKHRHEHTYTHEHKDDEE